MMMIPSKIFSLLQFFTLLYLLTVTFASIKEATALLKWKATFKNQNNSLFASWTPSSNSCRDWYGVICFNGTVPPQIGSLAKQILHMFDNHLNGFIHEEIGHLKSLLELDLSFNTLRGVWFFG
ncbi:hypothetical protein H5410_063919 [Solanum commersonii]|uniref:Leucine-rich repeat-containing N-terminal plant-type domain-containing protein n=1 Tax=Solanum commersonii TaxID=4109 RepID=A0A9J5WEJ1_SOLCO|nr:hypothetical protein H5410_063919 [Solanum commersonii]